MIHKYVCTATGCGAQIALDDEKRTQHTVYPRGRGPLSASYRPHDCPVRGTLWPPEATIDLHPLARKLG